MVTCMKNQVIYSIIYVQIKNVYTQFKTKTMKNLIIILILLLPLMVYSQDSTQTQQISEIERIIDKYGEKIIDGFNNVIEKTTPYAEKGFEIAVRLQIAKGIAFLISAIFGIWLIFYSIFSKRFTDWVKEEYAQPIYLIHILIVPLTVWVMHEACVHLIAPEWFAVKEILELF